MEPTLYLLAGGMAVALLFFGLASRMRIYNFFSAVLFIFLAIATVDYVALMLAFIGLALFQTYFAFFAKGD
jgi:hypothetical protein